MFSFETQWPEVALLINFDHFCLHVSAWTFARTWRFCADLRIQHMHVDKRGFQASRGGQ